MSDLMLFDDPALHTGPQPDLSADRRRTLRQHEAVEQGVHPLTGGPLHELAAPELCHPGAERGQAYTCGSCRFRAVLDHYPKCVRGWLESESMAGITHGAGSDCRGWWPACLGYQPGDPGLSPDAARSVPEDQP